MLHVSPGPYRDDMQAKTTRLENELKAAHEELLETQNSLSLERADTRLLQGENRRLSVRYGVTRPLVLLYGAMRWGLNRSSSALAGFAFVFMATLSYNGPVRHEQPHHATHQVRIPALPDAHYPTMLAASRLFDRWFPLHCYSQLMCHESCAVPYELRLRQWTWGGENPYLLPPYETEADLIVSN